jgi:hypothetical protein
MAVTVAIIGVAISALAAGYGAYSASEAQAQQNAYAKRAMKIQADAEEAAGTARANQIKYDAAKKQKSFLSRAAAAGVNVDSPSLLESETQFAYDTTYAEQLAKYPHQIAGYSDKYQSDLFGFASNKARNAAGMNAGIAAGSTLASGAAKYYGSGYGSTINPNSGG